MSDDREEIVSRGASAAAAGAGVGSARRGSMDFSSDFEEEALRAEPKKIVPPTGRTAKDIDKLLNLWADMWAREHGASEKKGSYKKWIAYKEEDIAARLASSDLKREQCPYLAVDILKRAEVEVVSEDLPVSSSPQVVGGSKVTHKNDSSSAHEIDYTWTHTLTTQETLSWTNSAELDVTLEGSGGVPLIASAQLTIGVKLGLSRTKQITKTDTETTTLLCKIPCPAGAHTTAVTVLEEHETRTQMKAVVQLIGGVVVCCRSDVCYKDTEGRRGAHAKWYVSIHEILCDLARYVALPETSTAHKVFIQSALDAFLIQGANREEICFYLIGEKVMKKLETRVDVQEAPIPGYVSKPVVAVTAAGAAPADISAPRSAEGIELYSRSAVSVVKGAEAIKITGQEDFGDEHRKDMITILQNAPPGTKAYLSSAVSKESGASAIVLPKECAETFFSERERRRDRSDDTSRSGSAPGRGGE